MTRKIQQSDCLDEEKVECSHVTATYIFCMIMCLGLGIIVLIACFGMLSDKGISLESMALGLAFVGLFFLCVAFGTAFFMLMKNRKLILYPDKIIFIDMLGHKFCYSSERIKGYACLPSGYRRSIHIYTDSKKIFIDSESRNFNQAVAFMARYYNLIEET